MINKDDFSKIIAKYALILIALYLFEYLLIIGIKYAATIQLFDVTTMGLLWHLDAVMSILLNIIVALVIRHDIKRLEIKSKYLVLLTLLWRPLGVSLFLISLLNQNRNNQIQPIN